MDIFGGQLDPNQFIFRPHKYLGDFNLLSTAHGGPAVNTSLSVTLRGNEMFFIILRLMAVGLGAESGLPIHWRTQIYTSTSQRYHSSGIINGNDRVRDECLWGNASRPAVLPLAIIIPGSSSILLDLESLDLSQDALLHLVFDGIQAFPKGSAK
jgi:hypothetical protein